MENVDAPARNRTAVVIIAIAVVVIVVAGLVLLFNRDEGNEGSTDYATAETLTESGALMLWDRWLDAVGDCNLAEMRAVGSPDFLETFSQTNGSGASSLAEACSMKQDHERFKSVTTVEPTNDPPQFTGGIPPTLVLGAKITTADLLGGNKQVRFTQRSLSYVRGSDGYWRIDSARWVD